MLVTVDTLVDRMSSIQFTQAQRRDAEIVLNGVQRQLENYLNRPVEPTLVQERRQCLDDGSLRFSYTPVIKILSITDGYGNDLPIYGSSNGTSLVQPLTANDAISAGVDAARFEDRVGTSFFPDRPINYGDIGLGVPGAWYVLKYVAGYIGDTTNMQTKILDVAARIMAHNHDDSVSIMNGVTSQGDSIIQAIDDFGFTVDELRLFQRAKRRVVV